MQEVSADEIGRLNDCCPVGRNMPSGTSLPTWTSCQACPRKESKIWPKEFGCPLRNSFRSHSQPFPRCWATSYIISGTTPIPIRPPLTQGPCWYIVNRRWTADEAEKIARHPPHENKALNY